MTLLFRKKVILVISMTAILSQSMAARDFVPDHVFRAIFKACQETNVPLDIGIELAWNESQFKGMAINMNLDEFGRVLSIDKGLFQLNTKNYELFRKAFNRGRFFDPMNIETNALLAMRFVKDLWMWHGTWRKVIYFWNCGRVVNVPKSTIALADAVLKGG